MIKEGQVIADWITVIILSFFVLFGIKTTSAPNDPFVSQANVKADIGLSQKSSTHSKPAKISRPMLGFSPQEYHFSYVTVEDSDDKPKNTRSSKGGSLVAVDLSKQSSSSSSTSSSSTSSSYNDDSGDESEWTFHSFFASPSSNSSNSFSSRLKTFFNFSSKSSFCFKHFMNLLQKKWVRCLLLAIVAVLFFRFGTFSSFFSSRDKYRDQFCELQFSATTLAILCCFLYFIGPAYAVLLLTIRLVLGTFLMTLQIVLNHIASKEVIKQRGSITKLKIEKDIYSKRKWIEDESEEENENQKCKCSRKFSPPSDEWEEDF